MAGQRTGVSSEEPAKIRRLRAELKEFRRANDLVGCLSFLRDELDRPLMRSRCSSTSTRMFSRSSRCAASCHSMARRSQRATRAEITRVWKESREVWGADKAWLELNRGAPGWARCTTRLMRQPTLQILRRGLTTAPSDRIQRFPDRDDPSRRAAARSRSTAWLGPVQYTRSGAVFAFEYNAVA
jgi:hypothetical protein